jgi:LSD1 subclass zinc finger protein
MPLVTICPSCNRDLRIPEGLAGKTVRCPACQATFVAQVAPEPVDVYVEPETGPASEQTEDAYERYEMPQRRRRTDVAKSLLLGPGIALLVIGLFALLNGLLGGLIFGIPAMQGRPGPPNPFIPRGRPVPNLAVFQLATVLCGLIYGACLIAGSICMLQRKVYPLAMTGAIAAMLPCSICCVFGLPFGIWGLVILNKPEVRNAFL